jgi:signal transduction histidine kinase
MNETAEIKEAYAARDRQDSIANAKVGCLLASILMPLGSFTMDLFKYEEKLWPFFWLRLASGILTLGVLGLLYSRWRDRYYRILRMAWYWIPMFCIGCMIFAAQDPRAPYYAGENLVLIAVGVVLPWTYREILGTSLLVLVAYATMSLFCGWHREPWTGNMANNLFFIGCTGTIVVTGSFFYSRLRKRDFENQFQLEQNRKTIEENNRKLVELDASKSRFFANISHELRTPLTLLIAPLETLLHRFNFDQETRELLGTMHANGMRLLKLINDLLDLVRLESGRIEVKSEPVEVEDFVKGLASAARQVAQEKRIRLETRVDPELQTVLADRDKLEKIVINLVFNALKFTPAGGSVEVRAVKQGEELVLTISDTGMGIAEKNLPFVFDRFWQADGSSKRKYQGVGIGLALVKEFTEIQGGRVTVESKEGEGTIFTVRLPYRKAEREPGAALEYPAGTANDAGSNGGTVSSQEWLANLYRRAELFPGISTLAEASRKVETERNGNHPTVLVADDEPDMLRFLKSQLSTHYQIIEAVDGQQAIDKATQFLPDLILLDMMMPEKDGLQACREIRQRASAQSIPIILLTARADEETKLAALSAGASDFLPKPFSVTELHVRVKNLVESHNYQRKLSKQNTALENTIEQLKETETQLVQTEKLASLGRMSAGIIHEINNPLNFATTGLFTLRNKSKYIAPDQQEDYDEILRDVEEGIKRVKTIVSDLRSFSHPDNEALDQVEVAEIVTSSLRFLSGELKDKVQIQQHIPEHQTIWANKNKMIQVMVNLLQNSLDALKSRTWDHGEKPTIGINGRVENGLSILSVRDNGTGIESKHLDKIFDPFYTTKDVGEGMGLGLSICYRIVQECDGRIRVNTEPGRFCEFVLEFPAKGSTTCD